MTIPGLGIDLSGAETIWLSLLIALILLFTAGLRLFTVVVQSAEGTARVALVSRAVGSGLFHVLAFPQRIVTHLSRARRRRARRGVPTQATPASDAMEPRAEAASPDAFYRRVFVGREAELQRARDAFDRAASGRGSLLMVVGEPGIGKTALCEQLADYVTGRGGQMLVGHCYEEGSLSLPYLPFVEALRTYVLTVEAEDLKGELGNGAPDVARIVSEIRDKMRVELRPAGDPEEDRWRLLNAVTDFLRSMAQNQPLMLMLEDLHWADRGTVDLLVHLARSSSGAPLLVVGTYRDVEVDRSHPLSGALVDLRRVGELPRILLRGLTPDEVQRLINTITGQEVRWGFAESLHRQTEGNPLFIQEVLRYLVEEGEVVQRDGRWEGRWRTTGELAPELSLPEGLRDVIGKRLTRLSPECNRLLSIAAVIGREFDLAILETVAGAGEEAVLAGLEEAARVGVLEERTGRGSERLRFSHAFFRQTLYEEMFAPRRNRLHVQIARSLETQHASRLEEHAAELVEHFAQSTESEDLAKAVKYGELAARASTDVYAHGEAVRFLEQALEAQEALDPSDQARRCDLLLALGEVLGPAGESLRAAESVAPGAFALAEALGDRRRAFQASLLATLALRRHGSFLIFGTPSFREWAERADLYAAPDTVERVWADICLAQVQRGSDDRAASWDINWRAVELARKLDDRRALYAAADLLLAAGMPTGREEDQLAVAQDVAQRPRSGVGPPTLDRFLMNAGAIFIQSGERSRAEDLWRELNELAGRSHDPSVLIHSLRVQAWQAAIDGELDAALEIAERLRAIGEESGAAGASQNFAHACSQYPLLWLGKDEEALAARAETSPLLGEGGLPMVRFSLRSAPLALAEALAEALAQLPPTGTLMAPAAAWYLELAVLLEDREAAATLTKRLDSAPPLSFGSVGLVCVARHLGDAAAFLGDPEKARDCYQRAFDACDHVRFRPEIALARLGLAEVLLDGTPEERVEAHEHLDFAIAEFQAMKMEPSLERALSQKAGT